MLPGLWDPDIRSLELTGSTLGKKTVQMKVFLTNSCPLNTVVINRETPSLVIKIRTPHLSSTSDHHLYFVRIIAKECPWESIDTATEPQTVEPGCAVSGSAQRNGPSLRYHLPQVGRLNWRYLPQSRPALTYPNAWKLEHHNFPRSSVDYDPGFPRKVISKN